MSRPTVRKTEMDTERLKQEIRRRLFASRRRAGLPAGPLDEEFATCPRCSGRGKVCIESADHGVQIAALDECPLCHGDGFVAK